ncbi:uncharacterized protein G6M90_00g009230 [Metarhizium brunneum]|uniref:Uncharacterized protein n=1 Tax=Metarhizium brunneum TaxID=500148 RepID=A0A7D5Z2D9_9HYPO|nr:hypothetical protein G6M90_00g009230 [Metarhizium brunneum]
MTSVHQKLIHRGGKVGDLNPKATFSFKTERKFKGPKGVNSQMIQDLHEEIPQQKLAGIAEGLMVRLYRIPETTEGSTELWYAEAEKH